MEALSLAPAAPDFPVDLESSLKKLNGFVEPSRLTISVTDVDEGHTLTAAISNLSMDGQGLMSIVDSLGEPMQHPTRLAKVLKHPTLGSTDADLSIER